MIVETTLMTPDIDSEARAEWKKDLRAAMMQVREYVKKHPGCRRKEVAPHTRLAVSTALRRLVAQREIRETFEGRYYLRVSAATETSEQIDNLQDA